MTLTKEQHDGFVRDGFVVVPEVFDRPQMQAALAETEKITYGCSYAEVLVKHDERDEPFQMASARSQFPCGVPVLDCLLENERYLGMYADCLGDEEPSYGNGHLFVRSALSDRPHGCYHVDHDTNSFLPPSHERGSYEYVNSWIFLHDVEADGAPLQVIPGSHRQWPEILPRLIEQNLFEPRSSFLDVSKVPEFAAPISVTAKAGSALFYSSYLVHSAIAFENARAQRAVWTMSLVRGDNRSWAKFSNVWNYAEREYSAPFFARTTPRVRSLFGWPPPGHSYYTPQTLELLAHWFPGIDLDPYSKAAKTSFLTFSNAR